jgi:peptide/nickel transport system permease protein
MPNEQVSRLAEPVRRVISLLSSVAVTFLWLTCATFFIGRVAGLGFLGLATQPPAPEWDTMVSFGRQYLLDQCWAATIPDTAMLIVSLGFNLLDDGLRDVSDSRAG